MPVTFANSESFLQLPYTSTRDIMSVGLQFRTWNKAGLLMTFDLQHQAGTLWVYLSEARARMQVHKAGRVLTDITAGISRGRYLQDIHCNLKCSLLLQYCELKQS